MISIDKDWAGLVSLWKSSESSLSFEKLMKRVRSETHKQFFAYFIEGTVSLCMIFVLLRDIHSGLPPAELTAALFAMLFTVFWMAMLTRTMKGTWQAAAKSTDAFLTLCIHRREVQVRWSRFVRKCSIGLILFVFVWGPWMIMEHWTKYKAEPWRAFVGFSGIFLILLLIELSIRFGLRKVNYELQSLYSTMAAFKQADEVITASEQATD